ncbi:MAG TPA: HAD family hydrolase [Anaerolineales bacterium]|nr:HAD family hydrolase [Anaerolineales bacterium]
MIRGLLVDLDDTLLDNDMGRFLPAYFQLLGQSFSHRGAPEVVLQHLLRASKRMMENQDPLRTLKGVFDSIFYPALGVDADASRPEVEAFYRDVFPALRSLTAPRPAAVDFIASARRLGLGIVVATNPLMPEPAVLHRLDWAGLRHAARTFDLITSYEDFHFAKPDPAYFGEILGRMGWRPGDAVMVGNDPAADLEPAASVGMAVFRVGPAANGDVAEGDLHAAAEWIRNRVDSPPAHAAPLPAGIIGRLRGQMAALHHLTRFLSPADWTRRPDSAGRSPVEIVCHLRDMETEVTLPRLEAIRREHNPFLPAPDTTRWVVDRQYARQSGPPAFRQLADQRALLLDSLETLAPDEWARPARHALLGPTTLAEVLSTSAEHELVHLADLRAATAQAE